MRNYMTKRNTLIASAIIAAVLLIYGICYLSVIKPLKEENSALDQQVSMYKTQYDRMTTESDEAAVNDELEDVADKVPNQKNPDQILINLQEIADTSDVTITYVGLQQDEKTEADTDDNEQEREAINSHLYAMDANGDNLADMNHFLNGICESKRLLMIDTLSINQSEDTVNLSVTFRAFSSSS